MVTIVTNTTNKGLLMFKLAGLLSVGYMIAELALVYFGISSHKEAFNAWTNFSLGMVNFIMMWKYVWN